MSMHTPAHKAVPFDPTTGRQSEPAVFEKMDDENLFDLDSDKPLPPACPLKPGDDTCEACQ